MTSHMFWALEQLRNPGGPERKAPSKTTLEALRRRGMVVLTDAGHYEPVRRTLRPRTALHVLAGAMSQYDAGREWNPLDTREGRIEWMRARSCCHYAP